MAIVKKLVPKNRLKEMTKWLGQNPGKSTQDFVNEVINMEELEVRQPSKKKKKTKQIKDRDNDKLKKISDVVKFLLQVDCFIDLKASEDICYSEGKIALSLGLVRQRGVIPVVIANAISKSEMNKDKQLEEFIRVFGNTVTIKLLK